MLTRLHIIFPDLQGNSEDEIRRLIHGEHPQTERIAPAARVHAAIRGAALTVLGLVGGLLGGLIGGSLIIHALIEKVPDLLTYALAAIAFFGATLGGSAL